VHALFSLSSKIGAQVISLGSTHLEPQIKPTPSHTALLVNERWVHESTGKTGVQVLSYDKWQQEHTEVGRVFLQEIEYQKIADKYREINGKPYDYPGVFYLAYRIGLTFLGIKLPLINKYESPSKYFCCEALGFLTGHYYGMSAPVQCMAKLQKELKG
jgi:hypothetical protein